MHLTTEGVNNTQVAVSQREFFAWFDSESQDTVVVRCVPMGIDLVIFELPEAVIDHCTTGSVDRECFYLPYLYSGIIKTNIVAEKLDWKFKIKAINSIIFRTTCAIDYCSQWYYTLVRCIQGLAAPCFRMTHRLPAKIYANKATRRTRCTAAYLMIETKDALDKKFTGSTRCALINRLLGFHARAWD
ncbi:hypothetical protein ACTXT7_016333 [Hymenolepis weldensis]